MRHFLVYIVICVGPISEMQAAPNAESEALIYMAQYGYVDPSLKDSRSALQLPKKEFSDALVELQRFAGLPVTGTVDSDTLKLMRQPRCGLPDKEYQDEVQARFKLYKFKWSENMLSYKISKYPRGWKLKDVNDTVAKATALWSQATEMKFMKIDHGRADIDFRFELGNHGDSNPFDGRGGSLAHANFPNDLGTYVHFDESENWTVNKEGAVDLLRVAVHEIGHVLGLHHSSVKEAMMNAFSHRYVPNLRLHEDDIKGIQSLYGKPKSVQKKPYSPTLCQSKRFDTIFSLSPSQTYIFKDGKYWLVSGESLAPNYPRYINSTWRGLPGGINAVFTSAGKTYFFRGSLFWRFTGFKMDIGYPKQISKYFTGVPSYVQAALKWRDGNVVFFKDNAYYFYQPNSGEDATKHPMVDWGGLPNGVQGALKWSNGFYYFFKDNQYWRLDDDNMKVQPGYPRPVGKWWFGC